MDNFPYQISTILTPFDSFIFKFCIMLIFEQTTSDSTWTETIKNTGVTPNTVDSSQSLGNFKSWINENSGSLPNHDHAMLFTK